MTPPEHSNSAAVPDHPGLLRLLVLFHETEALGASASVLRCVEELETYGWATSGWLPGRGPLSDVVRGHVARRGGAPRPFAFSGRGWREAPGVRLRLRRTPAYLRALRQTLLRLRPSVVHANTLLTVPEAVVARSLGLPLVIHVHEHPDQGFKTRAAVRAAARLADVLVAVSQAAAEALRAGAGATPVYVVPNGVPAARGARHRLTSDGCTIGTVGTVSRTKGTDVYFRAARIAAGLRPELRFEHVGSPDLHRDTGLDEELETLTSSPPLEGRLTRRGRVPADVALADLDVFVLASRSEAFPLATLEAMASGLPVIASAVGGVPEQLAHLETGILVPPDDPQTLAEWMVRLADDDALRARLGAAAAERVRTSFTIERQAAGLHRAYLAALVRRHGPQVARSAT